MRYREMFLWGLLGSFILLFLLTCLVVLFAPLPGVAAKVWIVTFFGSASGAYFGTFPADSKDSSKIDTLFFGFLGGAISSVVYIVIWYFLIP